MKNTLLGLLVVLCISCASYTKKESKLILSGNENQAMRVFLLTKRQDSILLRKKAKYIKPNSKLTRLLAKRMLTTVRDSLSMGVGIAAPQVGVSRNIICVQRFDKENIPFEFYLNPIILEYSKEKFPCQEGCLSIPNVSAKTKNRSKTITLEYDNLDGLHRKETITGFTAVIFQHEIDHLNGILFIDHLNKELN